MSKILNDNIFAEITKKFGHSTFSSRIICLIVHGSSLFLPIDNHPDRDVDLELILDLPNPGDYQELKEILKSIQTKIECQLRYLPEITDNNSLIWQTQYKLFMYFAYNNGRVLLGKNIYNQLLGRVDKKTLKNSILISTQIYYKDIRKSYLGEQSPYNVNKNIARTLFNVLFYRDILNIKKLGKKEYFEYERKAFVPLILGEYNNFLDDNERKILEEFVTCYANQELYPPVFTVVDKIMAIFSGQI